MKTYFPITLLLLKLTFAVAQAPVIPTEYGLVEGLSTDHGIQVFKGIPFAAPPVGELRWKAPQPATPWEGVRKCTAFGPSPMQRKPAPFMFWSSEFLIPETPIAEDCLYLNVWTKNTEPQTKKPVLVYIYGGGFQSGGSACAIYDGSAMAQKGIVFVSINYRVGVFGFLAHPKLSAETTSNTSGNYAILDMIAALKWVRQNISAFGGDPDHVTIAGQSAGAFAVNYLTVSPLAKGLFHKAIAQSGGNFYTAPARPVPDLKTAEDTGVSFANSLGCKTIADLRGKSAQELLGAEGGTNWPIIDGHVIREPIYDTYSRGSQAHVPLLVGWNADDLVFIGQKDARAYRQDLKERFGDKAPLFLEAYPGNSDEEALRSQRKMGRDETFAIQGYTWARMHRATAKSPVFVYNFNRRLPARDEASDFGAFHSGEIVYAYDNLHTLDRPWEAADREIASAMSGHWASFVKTGNPNREGLPRWNEFTRNTRQVLVLDKKIKSEPLPDAEQLSVWDSYYQDVMKHSNHNGN